MTTIAANLQAVRDRIARAARESGRAPSAVTLIAVSKTWPAERVAEALACGQHAFGENYVQEAVEKIIKLSHLRPLEWRADARHHENKHAAIGAHPSAGVASPQAGPLLLPLEWHFIGPIQSNKTRAIAEHFQWVHSVDREKIAVRLNDARPAEAPPINVCIQVNVSGEAGKSGVAPGEEPTLARTIAALPRLRLRGLMAIPEPTPDAALHRRRFALLRQMKENLQKAGFPLDTLSMGMSDDLEAAILEGATMVRVGTAIFGQRQRS